MARIQVTGKGNLGFSAVFGEIVAGQTYTIAEDQFTDQLFIKDKDEAGIMKDEKKPATAESMAN